MVEPFHDVIGFILMSVIFDKRGGMNVYAQIRMSDMTKGQKSL